MRKYIQENYSYDKSDPVHTLVSDVDPSRIEREKKKARELRRTAWWKRKRSRGICYYCKGSFSPALLTMDHIIPLSQGGRSVKANITACCKACNTEKKNRIPTQWGTYMERLQKG